ncbi:hypothetical protein QUQ16_000178 [Escherichia coli]|nr:hypothetical protein [Escherichia coli]
MDIKEKDLYAIALDNATRIMSTTESISELECALESSIIYMRKYNNVSSIKTHPSHITSEELYQQMSNILHSSNKVDEMCELSGQAVDILLAPSINKSNEIEWSK